MDLVANQEKLLAESYKALLLNVEVLFFMASQSLKDTIANYENYIKVNGITEELVNAYCKGAEVAIKTEKDLEYGLELSKRTKELIDNMILSLTGGNVWALDSYCNANKVTYTVLDLYYQVLLLEAPYLFDSYLLYYYN